MKKIAILPIWLFGWFLKTIGVLGEEDTDLFKKPYSQFSNESNLVIVLIGLVFWTIPIGIGCFVYLWMSGSF